MIRSLIRHFGKLLRGRRSREERPWFRSYDARVPRRIDFQKASIPEFFEQSAARFPDTPALVFLNRQLTYSELKEEVDRLAGGLAELGVQKETRVAIQLPNLPQTVISLLATLKLGAQALMTNPLYMPHELKQQWNHAGCELVITTDQLYQQKLRDVRDQLAVRNFLVTSVTDYLRFPVKQLARLKLRMMDPPGIATVEDAPGIHQFREVIRSGGSRVPDVPLQLEDLAVVQYTSATSGAAKGVMLSHRNLSFNTQQNRAWFPELENGREVFMGVLPYFHIFGLTVSLLLPLYIGATIILVPDPRDVASMVKNITRHRVTLLPGVPAMFNGINHHSGIEKVDLSSLKACISGSAPLPRAVLESFETLTGSRIVEGYGLTEASPVTHVNPFKGVREVGSIGLPLPDTEAKVVDVRRGRKTLDWGEEGELVVRGPQIMRGYWKSQEETAEVLRDGWLYTGDLATMDQRGYFRIVGRKKDIILASGYNVYPDEVDSVLVSYPAVLEACTIGVPDPKRGETVKSFVVLKTDEEATEEEIREFCRKKLAAYKVPQLVVFRDQLPKSAMLKLLRRSLREEELAKSQQGSEKQ